MRHWFECLRELLEEKERAKDGSKKRECIRRQRSTSCGLTDIMEALFGD